MSMLIKSFTVIKNNWKKSVAAAALTGYGVYSLKKNYEITKHMRSLCQHVMEISNQQTGATPKKVLVVLNPAANNKKCEKNFKKYCEPILHLAGCSVDVLKTTQIGHAKSYIESMKSTPDAIVIAGGDGTISEVVTGLLRRKDTDCPIALLPLGRTNQIAQKIHGIISHDEVRFLKGLSQTILPMIEEKAKLHSVMQFDVIDSDNNQQDRNRKPIFGLNSFSWGIFKDIELAKDKYWYLGPLKHYAAAFFKTYPADSNVFFSTNYVYTPPCPGCNYCYVEKSSKPQSFLSNLFFARGAKPAEKPNVFNENCNLEVAGSIKSNQISLTCKQNEEKFHELQMNVVNSIEPGLHFLKNVSNIVKNNLEPSLVIKCRTIQLHPTDTNNHCSIDGEEYDTRPLKVTVVPNAIKIYS